MANCGVVNSTVIRLFLLIYSVVKQSRVKTAHPIILTIAGSDPCCGAGLQADIRVASAIGCYATSVTTALTAQNTTGVYEVWPLSLHQVAEQGRVLLDDIVPCAVKVGMIATEEVAAVVTDLVNALPNVSVVVDTILRSTSGKPLLTTNGTGAFERLMSSARIITPNLPEAEVLLMGERLMVEEIPEALCSRFGGVSVYLKGGHGTGDLVTDLFYNAESGTLLKLEAARVDTLNTHGTGCCLSTALACYLAHGCQLDVAVRKAHEFTHKALEGGCGFALGAGHGPTFSF